jgi:hypothetical protein
MGYNIWPLKKPHSPRNVVLDLTLTKSIKNLILVWHNGTWHMPFFIAAEL